MGLRSRNDQHGEYNGASYESMRTELVLVSSSAAILSEDMASVENGARLQNINLPCVASVVPS
jgi:hypothetical protein